MPRNKDAAEELGKRSGRVDVIRWAVDGIYMVTDPSEALYDERALLPPDPVLVEDMAERGFSDKCPLLLQSRPGKSPRLIDGRRRLVAAREVQRRVRKDDPDYEMVAYVRLITCSDAEAELEAGRLNSKRLEDAPSAKALRVKRLHGLYGFSVPQIALALDVTPPTVKRWLELSEAAPVVQQAVDAGAVSLTTALEMAAEPIEEQRAVIEEGKRAGKRAAKRAAEKSTPKKPRPLTPEQVQFTINSGVKALAIAKRCSSAGLSYDEAVAQAYSDGLWDALGVRF